MADQINTPWNEQRFMVRGFIQFRVVNQTLLEEAHLRELIKQVDEANPWISYWKDGRLAPSIGWMSDVKMQDGTPGNRSYTIEIHPPYHLKADKFHPYTRYLNVLAEKLAAMDIEGVHTVRAYLEIKGGDAQYLTPTSLAQLEEIMKQPAFQELKALLQRE